jgi:uncharacterized membrane protein
MKLYQRIVRALFAVIFIGGGVSHFVLGRVMPDSYATFADTALLDWLAALWMSFVMPNIGWLTIVLGVYEIACGVGIVFKRTVRFAAVGMLGFLVFITVEGYGLPAATLGEDFLKNRATTIVMALLLVPLLTARNPTRPTPSSTSVAPD